MTHTFAIGDVVRIKSGGPPLTITEIRDDGWISTVCDPGRKS
jgi:uncharacterized protein YodC (DUF2158 family)